MHATKGDRVLIHSRRVGTVDRQGEIVDVRGRDGEPPYLVRWEPDGHEGLVFPGPDCLIETSSQAPGEGARRGW